jgi:very-short-patch-repair endonuclease
VDRSKVYHAVVFYEEVEPFMRDSLLGRIRKDFARKELGNYEPIKPNRFEQEVADWLRPYLSDGIGVEPNDLSDGYHKDILVAKRKKRIDIECDGEKFQCGGKEAFRDSVLAALGYTVIRLPRSRFDTDRGKREVLEELTNALA